MADRGNNPGSPECGRWETLLADALDGQLLPEDEAAFTCHMAICPGCAALFEEARRGREWLEFLSAEPEIPAGLLDRILAQTGPGQVAGYGLVTDGAGVAAVTHPWQRPVLAGPGFANHVRRYAEPRLLMTVAMAFFSIALTLNLVGFKFTDVRLSDLRPSAVQSLLTRRIVTASIPILRYYDHLRFLYQVESSMPQAAPPEDQNEPAPKPAAPISAAPGLTTPGLAVPGGLGESKRNPGAGGRNGRWRVQPPVRSGRHQVYPASGASGYFLNASLKVPIAVPIAVEDGLIAPASSGRRWTRHAHSGSSPPQRQVAGDPGNPPQRQVAGDPGDASRASKRSSLWIA